MMLEATELGLGSVWICCFKPEIIKKEFNIPQFVEPINILAIGYGINSDGKKTTRIPLDELVSYEKY